MIDDLWQCWVVLCKVFVAGETHSRRELVGGAAFHSFGLPVSVHDRLLGFGDGEKQSVTFRVGDAIGIVLRTAIALGTETKQDGQIPSPTRRSA